MKRPGMAELAQAAGVSIATVDRFLNGREAVREDTRIRITEAAQRIGHPAARRLVPQAADLPELRFGGLLHKQGQDFYKAFADELHRAVALVPGGRGRGGLVVFFWGGPPVATAMSCAKPAFAAICANVRRI